MLKSERKYYLQAFFLALVAAAVAVLPIVIYSGGYLTYYGDYNAQQIPFFKHTIESMHNGELGWSWDTGLGVNFMAAYGGIMVSPFTWLAALFPAELSQYTMAPILVLKIAFCSLFAYCYVRRFVKRPESAVIGGLLYAFSGFSIYNIVYFFFHESLMLFPLLLIALEEAVVCKRRGVFGLTVFACFTMSYFFFFEECIFLVIYFVVRCITCKEFRINAKDFLCLAFESIAGCAMACFIVIPSIYHVFSMNRVGTLLNGMNLLFYENPERLGVIIMSFFLPPQPACINYIFNDYDSLWQSNAAFLPFFSFVGVLAFFRNSEKKNWLRIILLICGIFIFVPGLNAIFAMMNYNYYARWYFMPVLMMCLATVLALENEKTDWRFSYWFTFGATALLLAVYLFLPVQRTEYEYGEVDGTSQSKYLVTKLFTGNVKVEQIILFVLAFGCLAALWFTLKSRKKRSVKKFYEDVISYVVVASLVISCYCMFACRLEGSIYKTYNQIMDSDISLDDDEFFRINTNSEARNYAMLWGYSSPLVFSSMLTAGVTEMDGVIQGNPDSDLVARYSVNDVAYNALTRTKYYLLNRDKLQEQIMEGTDKEEYTDAIAYGTMSYYDTQGIYDIYKNDYVIPAAYSFDTYCTKTELEKHVYHEDQDENGAGYSTATNLMLHSVVLDSAQIEKYSDILAHEELSREELDFERFKQDVAEKNALSTDTFDVGKGTFSARTSYDRDRLVVFSVAYEDGWSAEIDGEPAKVECVNYAFNAVRVPAGEHEIVFTYKTPGLSMGIVISVVGAAALAVYCIVIYIVLKRRPRRFSYPMAEEQVLTLHKGYISSASVDDKEQ